MAWASVALRAEPGPALRVVVRARDVDAARTLGKIARDALEALGKASRSSPELADLADFIARLRPEATGDRVTLEADVERAAALVAVPVRQTLEAVRRPQCVRNLMQIALAMHNYHSTHNTFPPAYVASKDGKPLLSWRVLVLPFLEQKELFDQFHLDEPWDGPHNRTLISRMPAVYNCPSGGRALAPEGKTTYLTPRGPASLFPGARGLEIKDVTDGTSNTIMVVDAGDDLAVTWTRPDDWEVAPQLRTRGLFGHHRRGTNFAFADGSVHFLKETITPKLLQALITRDGGEIINSEDY
jgi:prepilin-type processing-associated H-X9-DG protein